MTESDVEADSSTSLKEKVPNQQGEESDDKMKSESVQDGIKDEESIENKNLASSAEDVDAYPKNTEGNDNGNEEKKDSSGSTEKPENITKIVENTDSENATPEVESANEEKTSEDSKDKSEVTKKDTSEESKNNDNEADVENASEKKEEGSSEDKEGNVATRDDQEGSSNKGENLGTSEADDSTGKEDTPGDKEGNLANVEDSIGDEELTKSNNVVEGVKSDNEAVNTDKDGNLGDRDFGNPDDENGGKTTESPTKNEAAEAEDHESEVNKSGEDDSKEGEAVESGTTEDGGSKEVNVDKIDTAMEKTRTEERSDDQTDNDNEGNDETTSVDNGARNNSEDLNNKEDIQNEEKDTPDETAVVGEPQEISTEKDQSETKEFESEIAVGPVADLDGNHEAHSQVSNPDDNKSEVPSEDIDDLVDELLAVTDDVDAGKKSEEGAVVIADDSSEKVEDDSQKSEDDGQPVVRGESSEKAQDDDQPSLEKDGVKSSEGQETEVQSSVQDIQDSSGHLDVETNEKAEEDSQRSGSGHTAYRVQADYLTRQVIAKQEKQIYLEEKLAETNRDLEIAERKVKDLQLRLKRFVKDDEAKDKKMRQMEKEYKDLADHMQQIEDSLESKSKNNNEGEPPNVKTEQQQKKNSSKMCVIL